MHEKWVVLRERARARFLNKIYVVSRKKTGAGTFTIKHICQYSCVGPAKFGYLGGIIINFVRC